MTAIQVFCRCLLFCLFGFSLSAQTVEFDDLIFSNEFEKARIESFDLDSNYLAVLIASSGRGNQEKLQNAQKRFDAVLISLKPEKLKKKSGKKQIKKVFRAVHDQLMLKYERENQFVEVFEKGYYNCVSATAIYAMALDRLDIEYKIKEEPEHVYLNAKLKGKEILMEGTDPERGYFTLSEAYKQAFVESLLDKKLITVEEIQFSSYEQIYAQFNSTKSINLVQLLGVQYHNNAIYAYEKEAFKASYESALKACYFYDCESFRNTLFRAAAYYFESKESDNTQKISTLHTLAKLDTTNENEEYLVFLEGSLIVKAIEEGKGDVKEVYALHRTFVENLQKENLIKAVNKNFSVLLASHYEELGLTDSAYFHFINALQLDTTDALIFRATIGALMRKIVLGSLEYPSDTVSFFYDNFKQFRQNQLFVKNYEDLILVDASNKLRDLKFQEAEVLVSKFERLSEKHANVKAGEGYVEEVYSKLALKQFRKSKKKALAIIEKGQGYAPNSRRLLNLKRMIDNS